MHVTYERRIFIDYIDDCNYQYIMIRAGTFPNIIIKHVAAGVYCHRDFYVTTDKCGITVNLMQASLFGAREQVIAGGVGSDVFVRREDGRMLPFTGPFTLAEDKKNAT